MTDTTPTAEHLLVFGDDGSSGADVAWLWVCNHTWPGWRAEVLTATTPPLPTARQTPATAAEWDSPHPRLLVAQSQLSSVRSLVIEQDRRLALNDRDDADLLVVGPHNLSRLRAMVLGSTTEWLLHDPPAPMVIIRSASPVRRVLACIDGSRHAQTALEAFARLPWATGTEVLVLGVAEAWSRPADGIDVAIATLEAAGITATSLVARGRPTDQILEHIDEYGSQLVVLGTRGLTGWERLRLGSTAGSVVRVATCSSLIAGAADPTDGEPAT